MLIFLDTEFTGFNNPALISLGLVADTEEEFYVEVPFPAHEASEFVRETVLPLLNRYPHAFCSLPELRLRLLQWLEIVKRRGENVEICIDSDIDWQLFVQALDGRVPSWCRPRRVVHSINELLRYSFHKKNGMPEHHALYDARANRYAFRIPPLITE